MKPNFIPFAGALVILGAFAMTGFSNAGDPFFDKASAANLAEIKAGKLAVEKGGSKIKTLGKQMVADHSTAEAELKAIAKSENITIAMAPDADHQQALADMAKLSGAAFDSAYMSSQLKDHQDAVALFSSETTDGSDAQAKAYAAKYLPKLKMHLQMFQGGMPMSNQ